MRLPFGFAFFQINRSKNQLGIKQTLRNSKLYLTVVEAGSS
jgi:hypothetical protein